MANNTPRPINYQEIRKGDKVQIEYMDRDIRVFREGIAFNTNYTNDWVTEQGAPIYSGYPGTTYSLIERPAPSLPDVVGSVIRVHKFYDSDYDKEITPDKDTIAVLDGDEDWIVIVSEYHKYLDPSRITEWSRVTITEDEES